MSKEMREQINKIKNFGEFLNENKYYDEESDEYYDLLKISINELILSKKSLMGCFNNFIDGKKSHSNKEPLNVWRTDNNLLFLVDGYHRVFESLLNSTLINDVIVVGEGYTDYYSEPSNDNVFKIDTNLEFNGLENIIKKGYLESLM